MLVPWNAAALATACLAALSLVMRRLRWHPARVAAPFAWEAGVILGLYAVWQKAGDLAADHVAGAAGNALWVWRVERLMHFPSELTVQRWVLPFPLVVEALNGVYAIVHVPALIVFLIWLFVRHHDAYYRWRNVGALLTFAMLAIQVVPVAPPRLLPQLGFVDTAARYHESVYGGAGLRSAQVVAAMPSVHVGWAVFIAVAVVAVSRSRRRWLILVHPALTLFAVVATANHWWLDGIVAAALVPLAVAVEAFARASWQRARTPVGVPPPAPAHLPVAAGAGEVDPP